jgi:hypothetical protein
MFRSAEKPMVEPKKDLHKYILGRYKYILGRYKYILGRYKYILGRYKYVIKTYSFNCLYVIIRIIK